MAVDRSKLGNGPVSRFQVGDCLSLGFSIWGRNLLPFATLSALVHAPLLAFMLLANVDPANPDVPASSRLAVTLLGLLLPLIATGAMTYGVVQQLRGQPASFGACVSVGLSRLFPVLGVGLLVFLCILAGSVLLVIPGFIVMCMLWVAVPVAVIERPGVGASLSRSAELTKGSRWPIFGVILLLFLLSVAVTYIVQTALTGTALVLVQFLVGSILLGSLQATVDAVAYWLLRSNREGATIEDLAAVFA